MDQDYQIAVLWQKVDFARSANPTIVCNAITDINSVLAILSINDDYLLEPLDIHPEISELLEGPGEILAANQNALKIAEICRNPR